MLVSTFRCLTIKKFSWTEIFAEYLLWNVVVDLSFHIPPVSLTATNECIGKFALPGPPVIPTCTLKSLKSARHHRSSAFKLCTELWNTQSLLVAFQTILTYSSTSASSSAGFSIAYATLVTIHRIQIWSHLLRNDHHVRADWMPQDCNSWPPNSLGSGRSHWRRASSRRASRRTEVLLLCSFGSETQSASLQTGDLSGLLLTTLALAIWGFSAGLPNYECESQHLVTVVEGGGWGDLLPDCDTCIVILYQSSSTMLRPRVSCQAGAPRPSISESSLQS